jgi:hypothetical protein
MNIIKDLNKTENKLFHIGEQFILKVEKVEKHADCFIIKTDLYEKDFSDSPICNINFNIPILTVEYDNSVYENENNIQKQKIIAFNKVLIENNSSFLSKKMLFQINEQSLNIIQTNFKEIVNYEC